MIKKYVVISLLIGQFFGLHGSAQTQALFRAIQNCDIGQVRHWIAWGADVNAKDEEGMTPLMRVICQRSVDFAKKVAIVKILIAEKADMESAYKYQDADQCIPQSPIATAIRCNYIDIIDAFIGAGININTSYSNKDTALHYAAWSTNPAMIKKVYEAGALVNCRNLRGYTPLYYAVQDRQVDNVLFLLQADADTTIAVTDWLALFSSPRRGHTPLKVCAQYAADRFGSVDAEVMPTMSALLAIPAGKTIEDSAV